MRRCRSCREADLADILYLGEHPLANELADDADSVADRFRLNLVLCPACGLVQIDETVPPERLFRNYVYRSSFSESMLSHARALVDRMVDERKLAHDSLVIEVASNDGYLLRSYMARGIPVLGIEPAENIAELARQEHGVPTQVAFFDAALAEDLAGRGQRCDVLHAHNVVAHVPDPNSFLRGIASVLKPGGVGIIEAPYVRDLIDGLEFDTIYHEHFSYFGVTAFAKLAQRNGLSLIDVERIAIHGGSVRYFVAHEGTPASAAVADILREEQNLGLTSIGYYTTFARRVDALRERLTALLGSLRESGAHLAAYSASAKGSTLLNTFGIGSETLEFTVDKNPLKQGRYMPAVKVPILPPSAIMENKPDCVVLLAWNFAEEIIRQQREYLEAGGRFLIPIPEPRFVDKEAAFAQGIIS